MGRIKVFRNCSLLRGHEIYKEDLWVREGTIIDPQELFFSQQKRFDVEIDCQGLLIAPGFIDLQINGAFGIDFTSDIFDKPSAQKCLQTVGKGLLEYGVTSYCPTIVTSPPEIYASILPWMAPESGGLHGPEILGAHVEGPFISLDKKGAHNPDFVQNLEGSFEKLSNTYGSYLSHVRIITLAPEQDLDGNVVRECVKRGITISLGHSSATLSEGESAVRNGARMVTHLFNAMTSFHHRDPGLLGLLTSKKLEGNPLYYGIIADGIHTHPAALRIAYRTNYDALCIVTDAIPALGFSDGKYSLGEMDIEVKGERAVISGTDTLCGAITPVFKAVKKLMKAANCSLIEALEAASLHPAQVLNIHHRKGTLDYGSDADFIILDPDKMDIISTWIAGECVYNNSKECNKH